MVKNIRYIPPPGGGAKNVFKCFTQVPELMVIFLVKGKISVRDILLIDQFLKPTFLVDIHEDLANLKSTGVVVG